MEIFGQTQFLLRLAGIRRQSNSKFQIVPIIFARCILSVDIVGVLVFIQTNETPIHLKIFTFGVLSEMLSALVCSFLLTAKRNQIDESIENFQEIILRSSRRHEHQKLHVFSFKLSILGRKISVKIEEMYDKAEKNCKSLFIVMMIYIFSTMIYVAILDLFLVFIYGVLIKGEKLSPGSYMHKVM